MENSDEQFVAELIAIQPQLYGFIVSLVTDRNEADEILQQTNLVLVRKQKNFLAGSNFGAWARAIAFHEVQTARKSFARRKLRLSTELVEQLALVAEDQSSEPKLIRSALRQCLRQLAPPQRELIKDRYSGVAVSKLAELSNRTVGAISQELYRIRATLAKCISQRTAHDASIPGDQN
ncbi:MAG: sigma-70 family RNA polymerase sigma factor [Pirellulaceae bacterium]|nr:sigma-70 family RNA polymerase sigma factor [Pirellulaceae bacterium]